MSNQSDKAKKITARYTAMMGGIGTAIAIGHIALEPASYVGGWARTSLIPPSTSAYRAQVRALGSAGRTIPQLEKFVTNWVRATDQMKRKQLADEVQKVALSEVTYVPWGEWVQPTASRKNVRDVLKFRAPVFWNVKLLCRFVPCSPRGDRIAILFAALH